MIVVQLGQDFDQLTLSLSFYRPDHLQMLVSFPSSAREPSSPTELEFNFCDISVDHRDWSARWPIASCL
jgi:hypothetical protein